MAEPGGMVVANHFVPVNGFRREVHLDQLHLDQLHLARPGGDRTGVMVEHSGRLRHRILTEMNVAQTRELPRWWPQTRPARSAVLTALRQSTIKSSRSVFCTTSPFITCRRLRQIFRGFRLSFGLSLFTDQPLPLYFLTSRKSAC